MIHYSTSYNFTKNLSSNNCDTASLSMRLLHKLIRILHLWYLTASRTILPFSRIPSPDLIRSNADIPVGSQGLLLFSGRTKRASPHQLPMPLSLEGAQQRFGARAEARSAFPLCTLCIHPEGFLSYRKFNGISYKTKKSGRSRIFLISSVRRPPHGPPFHLP